MLWNSYFRNSRRTQQHMNTSYDHGLWMRHITPLTKHYSNVIISLRMLRRRSGALSATQPPRVWVRTEYTGRNYDTMSKLDNVFLDQAIDPVHAFPKYTQTGQSAFALL